MCSSLVQLVHYMRLIAKKSWKRFVKYNAERRKIGVLEFNNKILSKFILKNKDRSKIVNKSDISCKQRQLFSSNTVFWLVGVTQRLFFNNVTSKKSRQQRFMNISYAAHNNTSQQANKHIGTYKFHAISKNNNNTIKKCQLVVVAAVNIAETICRPFVPIT